jgi:hypothetical protein
MSKLYVYGDSYANSEFNMGAARTQTWSFLLSTHFDDYENHARWGIGNDYIIEKFVEHNPFTQGKTNRDIGIVILSHPRRVRLPIHEGIDWLQSHSYTNENNKKRGTYTLELEEFQTRLRKNGWLRQVQDQIMFDQWRWRYMIDLQLHVLNTYSKYFDMLIVHTGFGDVAHIATKSPVWNKDLKASEGFVWLDLVHLQGHEGAHQKIPGQELRWVEAPLEIAPCHMSPQMNVEYYKIMLAACTTCNITKKHLKNGWMKWSDYHFERDWNLPKHVEK